MTVYVLVYGIDQTFLGVFKDKEAAVQEAKERNLNLADCEENLTQFGAVILQETI
jgi:hypothetical protein